MPKPNTTLILTLTTILLIPGLCYAGIEFDGVDDLVDIPYNASQQFNDAITVSVWMKPDAWTTGSRDTVVDAEEGAIYGYMLEAFNNSVFRVKFVDSGTNVNILQVNINEFPTGEWYHVAFTFEGAGITLYRNGTFLDSNSDPDTYKLPGGGIHIGSAITSGAPFTGTIAEVAIWDVALSASDIATLAGARGNDLALQVQPGNLVGYWAMNEGQDGTSADGDTITDGSGNANHGTGVDGANDSGLTWQGVSGVKIGAH